MPDTTSTQHVTPIPEHLRTVTPRLQVADAAAAIDFYAAAFGAVELGERFAMPDGAIAHAEIQIGDSVVMLGEGADDTIGPAHLCTYWEDVDAAWERAVGAGAQVRFPLADQFYGQRAGRLVDPFGHQWMLTMRIENVSAAEMAAREGAA